MLNEAEALAWAQARKKSSETVMVARCPCCSEWIAIYVDQTARQEIVVDTTLPIQPAPRATLDT